MSEVKFKVGDKVRNKATQAIFLIEEVLPLGSSTSYTLRRGSIIAWAGSETIESDYELVENKHGET